MQEGKLYMLQCRSGKRTGAAAVRIAVELVEEGLVGGVGGRRGIVWVRCGLNQTNVVVWSGVCASPWSCWRCGQCVEGQATVHWYTGAQMADHSCWRCTRCHIYTANPHP